MMYRLMRVRIYKRIFDKSVWVSEPEVEERSRAVLNTERPSFGEADIFPVGLTCLSAQCGARILKERKERITVLLLSADRRNGSPLPSIPFVHSIPFHSFISLIYTVHLLADALSNQTFKNSTEEHYLRARRVKMQVYAYSNVLKSLK